MFSRDVSCVSIIKVIKTTCSVTVKGDSVSVLLPLMKGHVKGDDVANTIRFIKEPRVFGFGEIVF